MASRVASRVAALEDDLACLGFTGAVGDAVIDLDCLDTGFGILSRCMQFMYNVLVNVFPRSPLVYQWRRQPSAWRGSGCHGARACLCLTSLFATS